MYFKHSAKRNFSFNRLKALFGIAAVCMISGCYDQPEMERNTLGPLPDDDEYELDIYYVSELAGRLMPEKIKGSAYGCIKDDKLYFKGFTNSGKDEENAKDMPIELGNESIDDKSRISVDDLNSPKKLIFDIYPGKMKPIEMGMTEYEPESTDIDAVFSDECAEQGKKYIISYEFNVSGVLAIKDIWKNVFGFDADKHTNIDRNDKIYEGDNDIIVSTGDNFGVSKPYSNIFNDVPTIQALNTMHMNADTFGNHSFDKNITYLKKLTNMSNYSYVISNMTNLPQNLSNVEQYVVKSIPSKNGKNSLLLGIFGLLDNEISEIVFPGRFGTLGFEQNYCSVIQAMESAYNKNVRAFLLLGHLYNDGYGIKAFLYNLISMSEKFDKKLINPRLPFVENCPSKLIIEKKKGSPDEQIKKKRTEIYNGIIGLYGEANDFKPALQRITIKSNENNEIDAENEIKMDVSENDEKSAFKREFKNDAGNNDLWASVFQNVLGYKANYVKYTAEKDADNKDNGVWFIQIPNNGTHTSRTKVKIERTEDGYHSKITSHEMVPVFSDYQEYVPSQCTEIYENCSKFIHDVEKGKAKHEDILEQNEYTQKCNTEQKKDNLTTTEEVVKLWSCLYNYLEKDPINDDHFEPRTIYDFGRDIGAEHKVDDLRNRATFIGNIFATSILDYYNYYAGYNSFTQYVNDKMYADKTDSDKELNKRDETFATLGTEKYFSTVMNSCMTYNDFDAMDENCAKENNIDKKNKYDFSFINAGAFRGSNTNYPDLTKDWISEQHAYKNMIYAARIKEQEDDKKNKQNGDKDTGDSASGSDHKKSGIILRDLILHGISKDSDGSFPIISGITYAYHKKMQQDGSGNAAPSNDKDSSSVEICEIWRTDDFGNLIELLYYDLDCKVHLVKLDVSADEETVINTDSKCFGIQDTKNDRPLSYDPREVKDNIKMDEIKNKVYASNRELNFLLPDFVVSGGDNYNKVTGDIVSYSFTTKKSIDEILGEYLIGLKQQIDKAEANSKIKNGIVGNGSNSPDSERSVLNRFNDERFLKRICVNNVFTNHPLPRSENVTTDIRNKYNLPYIDNTVCNSVKSNLTISDNCIYFDESDTQSSGKTSDGSGS